MIYYTHAGRFHCDEVTGYAITLLAGVCDRYERLTDIENLPDNGLIADIGRVYDPEKLRFDHHQDLILRDNGYPYATAGMLWKEYGKKVVARYFNDIPDIEAIANRVDEVLIQGIDAHDADNTYNVEAKCRGGDVRIITFPMIIAGLNTGSPGEVVDQRIAFEEATLIASKVILNAVEEAYRFVVDEERFQNLARIDGQICILPEIMMWGEIIHKLHPSVLYVICPSAHPGNPFSMTAVPVRPGNRELKKPIERPEWWNGFIHQGKWIAGGNSVEELVELALWNIEK